MQLPNWYDMIVMKSLTRLKKLNKHEATVNSTVIYITQLKKCVAWHRTITIEKP